MIHDLAYCLQSVVGFGVAIYGHVEQVGGSDEALSTAGSDSLHGFVVGVGPVEGLLVDWCGFDDLAEVGVHWNCVPFGLVLARRGSASFGMAAKRPVPDQGSMVERPQKGPTAGRVEAARLSFRTNDLDARALARLKDQASAGTQ